MKLTFMLLFLYKLMCAYFICFYPCCISLDVCYPQKFTPFLTTDYTFIPPDI